MANPLLIIGGLAAAAYLLMSGKASATPSVGTVVPAGDGKVTTTIPTPDGKGYVLTASKEDVAAIMTMATSNNSNNLRVMGKQYRALGKTAEAQACDYLAQLIELNQATGGRYTSATTSPKASSSAAAPPAELVTKLSRAVGAGDTAAMRVYASQFEALGFKEQADSIRKAADETDASGYVTVPGPAAGAKTGTVKTTTKVKKAAPTRAATPVVTTTTKATPSTALPTPVTQRVPTARRAAADALARELLIVSPKAGTESAEVVKKYQVLAGQKGDGKYGPGTAKSLADDASGRHIPPPPRYWPTSTYAKAANEYDAWLRLSAAEDPARAAEWATALSQSRLFYPSFKKSSAAKKKAETARAAKPQKPSALAQWGTILQQTNRVA